MKKWLMKCISILIAVSILSGSIVFAADTSNSYQINNAVPVTATQRQKVETANQAYTNLLNSFRSEYEVSRKAEAASGKVLPTKKVYTVDGIPAGGFPDYYAGAYVNKNYELVLMVTENTAAVRNDARTQAREGSLNYREAVYSYADLVRCMDSIVQNWTSDEFDAIEYAFIDDYSNCVVVGTQRIDEEYLLMLKNELDYDEPIVFVECEEISDEDVHLESETINATTRIRKVAHEGSETPLGYMSLGFKAQQGSDIGFVTAAHAAWLGDHVASDENYIGYVTRAASNMSVDAAFVKVANPDVLVSSSFNNRTVSSETVLIAQGDPVFKYGYEGEVSGCVVSTSFSMNTGASGSLYLYWDYVLTNYESQPGDSGGLTYEVSGNIAKPAGIHCITISPEWAETSLGYTPPMGTANDGHYKGYCKISYVLSALGVSIIS